MNARLTVLLTNAVLTGAVCTGILSLAGFCGTWSWVFDLCNHFRVQYAIYLAIALVVCIFLRKKWIPVLAILLLINIYDLPGLYLAQPNSTNTCESRLRLMQINLWAHHEDFQRLLAAIKSAHPDVISLQELTPKSKELLAAALPEYRFSAVSPQSDCFGIGFLSRLPLENTNISFVLDENGVVVSPPLAQTTVLLANGRVQLLSAHLLPPISSKSMEVNRLALASLAKLCRGNHSTIMMGDLNQTRFSCFFKKILADSGLKNSESGFGWQPSFPSQLPLIWVAIDHCLVSDKIKVANRRLAGYSGSDHYPLVVDLLIPPQISL